MKTLLKTLLAIIVFAIAFFIIAPILLKPKINTFVKDIASSQINGKLDFKDLDVSLIRRFPSASVRISNIKLDNYHDWDTSEVLNMEMLELKFNLIDILTNSSDFNISRIYLNKPHLSIVQLDSTTSTLSALLKENANEKKEKEMSLSIESYEIIDGFIDYNNRFTNSHLNISGLNHSGKFKTEGNLTTSDSKSSISAIDYSESGISLFKDLQWSSLIQLEIDKQKNSYNFKNSSISMNAFKLNLNGLIRLQGDSTEMQLELQCPKTDFKDLFSLLPNAYTKDYANVLSKGNFMLSAKLNGWYHALSKTYPLWDFNLNVADGELKYPGKSISLSDVRFTLNSKNQNSDGSGAFIHLDTMFLALGNSSIEGHVFYENFLKSAIYKGLMKGKLDFKTLSDFYPLSDDVKISGNADAKLLFSFTEENLKSANYADFECMATFIGKNIMYSDSKGLPMRVNSVDIALNPKSASINNCDLAIGESQLELKGTIPQFLNAILQDGTLQMNIDLSASRINLNQLMSDKDKGKTDSLDKMKSTPPAFLSKLDLKLRGNVKDCTYEDYLIQNVVADCSFNSGSFRIHKGDLMLNRNLVHVAGQFDNILNYVYKNDILLGSMKCNSSFFDLDAFLIPSAGEAANSKNSPEYLVFPSGMKIDIYVDANKVSYKPMVLNQVKGMLHLEDQALEFHDAKATVAGGEMALEGVLQTKENSNPVFNFKYDLNKLQFRKAFQEFTTISKLVPLFNYIEGYFNGSMIFRGELGKDLFPVYDQLSMEGLIETLEGSIKNFKPLMAISEKLKLDQFKSLNIKNTKNWFTVQGGTVQIQDFKRQIDDISMDVQGSHKISGPMDYSIIVTIPQSKLSKYTKGIGIDEGVNYFNALMKKAGIQKELSKNLNMLVKIKGTIAKPEISIKVVPDLGSGEVISEEGNANNDALNQATESAGKALGSMVEKKKAEISEKAQVLEDSIRNKAAKKIDEFESKAKETIEKEVSQKIDSTLGKVIKEPVDSISDKLLKGAGKKQLDSLKNKIKGWNPFKK